MPEPRAGESQDEFLERCIPMVLEEGTAEDNDQAVAICASMYEEGGKSTKAKFKKYTYNGVTVQATGRRSSKRDDKAYERTVRYNDNERTVSYADPDMPMRRNNEEAREAFNSRHSCSEKTDPFAPGFWACYDWNNVDEKSSDSLTEADVKRIVVEAMEKEDVLVNIGGSAKALGNGKVGGYLVRFTGPDDLDLEGDYFDGSTYYGPHKSSLVYYHHGHDSTLKRRVLDDGAKIEVQDAGVWIEAQLDLRDAYEHAIYSMADSGKLGWSSGTAPHLIEREQKGTGYHITAWPLGIDASLTPTPADAGNTASTIKSLSSYLKSVEALDDLSSSDEYAKALEAGQEGAGASVLREQAKARAEALRISLEED